MVEFELVTVQMMLLHCTVISQIDMTSSICAHFYELCVLFLITAERWTGSVPEDKKHLL